MWLGIAFRKLKSAFNAQTSNQSFKNTKLHHIPAPKRQAFWRPKNRRYPFGFAIKRGNEKITTNATNTQNCTASPNRKITHFGHPKITDTRADSQLKSAHPKKGQKCLQVTKTTWSSAWDLGSKTLPNDTTSRKIRKLKIADTLSDLHSETLIFGTIETENKKQ